MIYRTISLIGIAFAFQVFSFEKATAIVAAPESLWEDNDTPMTAVQNSSSSVYTQAINNLEADERRLADILSELKQDEKTLQQAVRLPQTNFKERPDGYPLR